MTCTSLVQPKILVGDDDQRSILNQIYWLALSTAMSHEDLERTWDVLSQEEHPNIIVCFPPINRDFWDIDTILSLL